MQDVQVTSSIHSIESRIDLVKREMESINAHINLFKRHFEELFKKPDVPGEFLAFKLMVDAFIKCTQDNHISTISTISEIKSTLQTNKITILNQENEIRMLRQSFPMLDQKIDDTKSDLSTKIVSISTAFSNKFEAHADKQKKQLEEFSSFALSAPKSVMETNKSISDKIDIALLESSNAIAKMCNIEQTLKMLDRKLEGLAIQVKKVELAQQV